MDAPLKLSVLIPTTGRRRETLDRVVAEYERQIPGVQVLIVEGLTWGQGINYLAESGLLIGDYWLTSCDDTLPVEGWLDNARYTVDYGMTPAARYFHPDGSPLHPVDTAIHGMPVSWCRLFLLTPAIYRQVGPMIDATWYADIDYSERLSAAGYPIVACDGYSFIHQPTERDWLTETEQERSRKLYEDSHRAQGLE